MSMNTVQIPLTLLLPEKIYARILEAIPGADSPAVKIQAAIDGLLEDMSEGGLMLAGEDMVRINECLKGNVDGESIAAAVEMANNMDLGQVVVRYKVDPSYMPALQEIADMQETDVHALVQNALDYAFDQGWIYEMDAKPRSVFVSREDDAVLAELLGNAEYTGADLVAWLKREGVIASAEFFDNLVEATPVADVVEERVAVEV